MRPTLAAMARATGVVCGTNVAAMRNDRRFEELVRARRVFAHYAHVRGGISQSQIARFLRCSPSTVNHGVQVAKELYGVDARFTDLVDRVAAVAEAEHA